MNGPTVAPGRTPLAATTEYVNDVVPAGGVPDTAPVVPSMLSQPGAPVSESVGAGVPLAANV